MAVDPRLFHAVAVTIQPIDRAATQYNSLAREPIKVVSRSAPITLQAQVQWTRRRESEMTSRAGRQEGSSGYLILLTKDLAGYFPQTGDKITSIDGQTDNLYITMHEPAGHYDGGNKLLKVDFEDRQPTRTD